MLKSLRNWVADALSDDESEEAVAAADQERRLDKRHNFTGHDVAIRDRRSHWTIHLKDLSCKGACGISDTPIEVGALVFLELRKKRFNAAEVRWVRNALIGLQFYKPLQPEMVEKLHEAHVARQAKLAAAARRGGKSAASSKGFGGRR